MNGSDATELLGAQIGKRLRGGEVLELCSDLGGGKTTFTRGLVQGAGSHDIVASPTFMVHKHYQAPTFTIEHFDFYRLNDPGQVADALAENVEDPSAVIVVEWADSVGHVLPDERVKVLIERTPTHEDERNITFTYPREFAYLLPEENQ